MFTLPLFPLNTVLFPGMPLQLHVFEERYLKMIEACLRSDREFGVVLIHSGLEALGPLPEPYQVGCVARIAEIVPLGQEHMNIVAVGRERFRIHSIDRRSEPYLTGQVELFPLILEDPDRLDDYAAHLRPRLERYIQLLLQMSDIQSGPEPLPAQADTLAYMAAVLIQIPNPEKQALLEIQGANELYEGLDHLIDRELALLRAMLGESSRSGIGVFSRN